MSTSEELGDRATAEDLTSSADLLGRWERIFAVVCGLAAGIVGVWAIFASSNQAGTAVLLIAAVIFLLIGVQGTPLIRFASGSGSVELERRKRNVRQALEQAKEETNADRALGLVEGASIAEPQLVPSGLVYERLVAAAINRLGYMTLEPQIDYGFDLIAQDGKLRSIYIETKCLRPGIVLPNMLAAQILERSRSVSSARILLVTNVRIGNAASHLIERTENVQAVMWRDESDDVDLSSALESFFRSLDLAGF